MRAASKLRWWAAAPPGLAAALTAAIAGLRTLVFAPPATSRPAARPHSCRARSTCCPSSTSGRRSCRHAAPLKAIRIVDATRRLIRAPEAIFHASEIGLPAFGFNVPNGDLVDSAAASCARPSRHLPAGSRAGRRDRPERRLGAAAGRRCRRFRRASSSAADGMRSLAREAAGIGVRRWDYRQAALVATFAHRAAASRRLDRVPHRERAVHARAAARRPREPCLGRPAGAGGGRRKASRCGALARRERERRSSSTARCASTVRRRSFR